MVENFEEGWEKWPREGSQSESSALHPRLELPGTTDLPTAAPQIEYTKIQSSVSIRV